MSVDSLDTGKSRPGFILGIMLTAIAILSALAVIWQIRPRGFVDFPCFDVQQGDCLAGYGPYSLSQAEVQRLGEARIYLCISEYPRGWQGGCAIAQGPGFSDTCSCSDIELTRQGDLLFANGESLAPSESTSYLRVSPTFNPWLFASTRTTVAHRGVFDCFLDEEMSEHAVDILYVYGSVSEGWALNPLGLIILAGGVWLLMHEARARKGK